MRKVALVVAVLMFGLGAAEAAVACSCIPNPPPREALDEADFVFAGRVLDIRNVDGTYPAGLDVTLWVERPFKGFFVETVVMRTARDSASCGFSFERGERYVVYAHLTEDHLAHVSLCSRTARLEDARADLAAFDALDLLDEDKDDGGGGNACGGPFATVQIVLLVVFGVALPLRRRRAVGS